MGHTIGEDPVSPVTANTGLIRVKHTIDIYQDQRGKLLHASTVRGRPTTGHTYAWLRPHRPSQAGRLASAIPVLEARGRRARPCVTVRRSLSVPAYQLRRARRAAAAPDPPLGDERVRRRDRGALAAD